MSTVDTARALWSAYRAARQAYYDADGHLSFVQEEPYNLDDPPERYREICKNVGKTHTAYEAAEATLKRFYTEHYGEKGAAILDEFLVADKDGSVHLVPCSWVTDMSDEEMAAKDVRIFNAQKRHAEIEAGLEAMGVRLTGAFSDWSREDLVARNTKIFTAQKRVDQAQVALDALTGVRVN